MREGQTSNSPWPGAVVLSHVISIKQFLLKTGGVKEKHGFQTTMQRLRRGRAFLHDTENAKAEGAQAQATEKMQTQKSHLNNIGRRKKY